MNAVVYETTPTLNRAEIVELYEAVGWSAYTKDPSRLAAAVSASLAVVTARRDDGRLIGLARLVGAGLTIVYLQDILILPAYRRRGIGREFFQRAAGLIPLTACHNAR